MNDESTYDTRTASGFDRWLAGLVAVRKEAANRGTWSGRERDRYFEFCGDVNPFRGISTRFTRDIGYHSSGWWKNPDYEQCFHLSLGFFDPATMHSRLRDQPLSRTIVRAFFGTHSKWVWEEPPYTDFGKAHDIWHYRLFCDQAWQPIKPRGEVYSKELTEAGWLSFSDVQDAVRKTSRNPNATNRRKR